MQKAAFVLSIVALAISALNLALIVTGFLMKVLKKPSYYESA